MINHLDYPKTDEEKKAAVKRSKAFVGKEAYHLFKNNCEHFVTEVLTGEGSSRQVQRAGSIFDITASTFLAVTNPAECKCFVKMKQRNDFGSI